MPGHITTSVIIPTYNGAHKVLHALDSLLSQSLPPDEVVLVIDGSTDQTAAIVSARHYTFRQFNIIEQANGGRAKVRNRGAREAHGHLLLFLDDDMIVPEHWLAHHVRHHERYADTILTGKLEDPNASGGNDFLRFKAWLNRKWNAGLPADAGDQAQIDYPYLSANNCSLPKKVFDALCGFDERLTDAEDYDLAVRAEKEGIPLYIGNAAFAWHNDITDCTKYIRRLKEYQKAQQKLVALKPELYRQHRYAVPVPKGIKRLVFRFFALEIWPLAINKGWLTFLPENIRYKIYDLVVTAKGVHNF